MKIRIEDGKTIISTGIGNDHVRNKTGVRGLTWKEIMNCYNLAFVYKGKKYHIGNYDTIEEGKSMRELADEMIANGTFEDWHKNLRRTRKLRPTSRSYARNKKTKTEGKDDK